MKILVTGFEPFGAEKINPSWETVRQLPDAIAHSQVIVQCLPVSFQQGEADLLDALERYCPDLVLCTGLAGGRTGVTVERVAINLRDTRYPDNDGQLPEEEPIRIGGPAAYFSTVPVRKIVRVLEENGILASISNTAGTYVCNDILYALLNWQSENTPEARGGFLHLPYTLEQAAAHGEGTYGMTQEQMTQALYLTILASLEEMQQNSRNTAFAWDFQKEETV